MVMMQCIINFENLVATHLLKCMHYLEDSHGEQWGLYTLRDKEGREVDFVLTKNHKVHALVEVKWADREISRPLQHYAEKLQPKHALQIVGQLKSPYAKGRCRVLTLEHALQVLFSC